MSKYKQVIATMIVMLLAGFGSTATTQLPTSIPVSSVIFLDRSGLSFPNGVEDDAIKNRISLDIIGICSLDKNVAFLYGLSSVGSVLLRTEDGGLQWQEVMQSDPRSQVRWVGFADAKTGWALVEDYWGEAGGPIALYLTTDTGKTWKPLSIVPTITRYWSFVNIQLFDAQKGQIDLLDGQDSEALSEYVFTWTTVDGGRTWQETNRRYVSQDAIKDMQLPHKLDRSAGKDGSQWEYDDRSDPEKIIVKRRLSANQPLTSVAIQKYWDYKNKRIVPR